MDYITYSQPDSRSRTAVLVRKFTNNDLGIGIVPQVHVSNGVAMFIDVMVDLPCDNCGMFIYKNLYNAPYVDGKAEWCGVPCPGCDATYTIEYVQLTQGDEFDALLG